MTDVIRPSNEQALLRRIVGLRGAVERIGLFHSDMDIPRECIEILKEDELAHKATTHETNEQHVCEVLFCYECGASVKHTPKVDE